jgi:hypothetical protein
MVLQKADMWSNGRWDPEVYPCSYICLICDNDTKIIHAREDSLFNKWYLENCICTCRKLKVDPYLSPCTKFNSKWTKNIILEPLKLLEETIGKTLQDTRIGSKFLNWIPIAQEIITRISKWDCIKLKISCTTKETITRVKCQLFI